MLLYFCVYYINAVYFKTKYHNLVIVFSLMGENCAKVDHLSLHPSKIFRESYLKCAVYLKHFRSLKSLGKIFFSLGTLFQSFKLKNILFHSLSVHWSNYRWYRDVLAQFFLMPVSSAQIGGSKQKSNTLAPKPHLFFCLLLHFPFLWETKGSNPQTLCL